MTFSTAAATGAQRRRRLELEARQLEHEHVGPRPRPPPAVVRRQHVEHRVADVAGDDGGEARGAAQRAGERGDGGLAVGAGDREHLLLRRQCAREELDVADEFGAARDGRRDRRLVLRNARADRDQVRAGQRRVVNGTDGERARSATPPRGPPPVAAPRACRRRARARRRARGSVPATARSTRGPAPRRCDSRISSSAQLQRGKTEQDEQHRDDPETDDDLVFLPALQFVVMVDRRHPEHALAGES